MRTAFRLMVLGIFAVLAAGCAQRSSSLTYNPAGFGAPDPVPVTALTGDYHLGIGDVVTVRVFNVDSLSGDQTIDSTGNVNLPLVGAVPAIGKTTDELGRDLAQRLGARYLHDPQVTVALKSAVPKTVTVDGSVDSPGVYPIGNRTTLLQTIALAHGTSEHANLHRVVIFRQLQGQRQAAAFDLATIRNGTDADPSVYPNDVVVVDGRDTTLSLRTLIQTVPVVGLFIRLGVF